MGAGIFADIAVSQNFQTVDRFLQKTGSVLTSAELQKIGRDRERAILRRNAGEENNFIFENWERTEMAIGFGLFLLLLFGPRPQKLLLAAVLLMTLIVAIQHFFLSPLVTDLGRKIADLPLNDPLNSRFWALHGAYSGSEILKLLIGFAAALRLSIRRKADPDHFAKEFETGMAASKRA